VPAAWRFPTLSGSPWLFIVSLLVFLGTFTKFGCLSN
jgi:hypothetical protein